MPKIVGRDRKQELLETARELIFTEGTTRFTIRRLADRVQISEAAIYRHYPSKEALLLSVLRDSFRGWQEGLAEIVEQDLPAGDSLCALAVFHVEHLLTRQFNPILLLSDATDPEQPELRCELQKIAAGLHEAMRRLVQKGVDTGEFSSDLDLDSATRAFMGGIQATVIQWSLLQKAKGLREQVVRVTRLVMLACRNPGRDVRRAGRLQDSSQRTSKRRTKP